MRQATGPSEVARADVGKLESSTLAERAIEHPPQQPLRSRSLFLRGGNLSGAVNSTRGAASIPWIYSHPLTRYLFVYGAPGMRLAAPIEPLATFIRLYATD